MRYYAGKGVSRAGVDEMVETENGMGGEGNS